MRTTLSRLVALGVVIAIGGGYVSYRYLDTPNSLIISPPAHTVRFQDGESLRKTNVTFEVTNPGRRPVRLQEPTTTCGCVIVGQPPQLIRPNETQTIVAQVTPPNAGSRDVVIRFPTDSRKTPELQLNVAVIVDLKDPMLDRVPERLGFFDVKEAGESRRFQVWTLERPDQEPWIQSAKTKLPFLDIARESVQTAKGRVAGFASRTYDFKATITELAGGGEHAGLISFYDRLGKAIDRPANKSSVIVRATFCPPLVVRPKRLYAEHNATTPLPIWNVDLLGREGDPPPKISAIECRADWLEIVQKPDSERACHVEIRVTRLPPESLVTETITLSATTVGDHVVRIPVTLRRT